MLHNFITYKVSQNFFVGRYLRIPDNKDKQISFHKRHTNNPNPIYLFPQLFELNKNRDRPCASFYKFFRNFPATSLLFSRLEYIYGEYRGHIYMLKVYSSWKNSLPSPGTSQVDGRHSYKFPVKLSNTKKDKYREKLGEGDCEESSGGNKGIMPYWRYIFLRLLGVSRLIVCFSIFLFDFR